MSAIKVTVLSADVDERGGTFKDDEGKDREYTTRKQKAKLEAGGFAYPLDVRLDKGQQAYQPGEYELDVEAMVSVNKGAINFSKFHVLRPLNKPATRAAA